MISLIKKIWKKNKQSQNSDLNWKRIVIFQIFFCFPILTITIFTINAITGDWGDYNATSFFKKMSTGEWTIWILYFYYIVNKCKILIKQDLLLSKKLIEIHKVCITIIKFMGSICFFPIRFIQDCYQRIWKTLFEEDFEYFKENKYYIREFFEYPASNSFPKKNMIYFTIYTIFLTWALIVFNIHIAKATITIIVLTIKFIQHRSRPPGSGYY